MYTCIHGCQLANQFVNCKLCGESAKMLLNQSQLYTYLTTQTHVVNRDAMTDTKFALIFTIQNALKLHILSVAEQFHLVTMMIEHTYTVAKTIDNCNIKRAVTFNYLPTNSLKECLENHVCITNPIFQHGGVLPERCHCACAANKTN